MADDGEDGASENTTDADARPQGEKSEGQATQAQAGRAIKPSPTRGQSDARPPTDEELDARERGIRPKRKPMGPPPAPQTRGASTASEGPADVPETVIDVEQDQ